MDYVKQIRKLFVKHARSQELGIVLDIDYSKELNRITLTCSIGERHCVTTFDLHKYNMLSNIGTFKLDTICDLFEEVVERTNNRSLKQEQK